MAPVVKLHLAERLINAIVQGRVHGLQCTRKFGTDPGDERRCFEDLCKVISDEPGRADAKRVALAVLDELDRIVQLEQSESGNFYTTAAAAQLLRKRVEAGDVPGMEKNETQRNRDSNQGTAG